MVVVAGVALLALGARTAAAVPVTFGFTGTITFFDEDYGTPPPELVFDGSIAPGVAFSGEYTFDSDAVGVPDPRVPSTLFWEYVQSGAPFGAHLEVGNYRFDWDNLRISVVDVRARWNRGGTASLERSSVELDLADPSELGVLRQPGGDEVPGFVETRRVIAEAREDEP